jgi:trk system potassium uptake protein TrkH
LWTTVLLIVLGAAAILVVDPPRKAQAAGAFGGAQRWAAHRKDDWPKLYGWPRVREALFQSVSSRTAGFNTIDCAELSNASKMVLCGLMMVGGSPASTAGGMKTVTFALLLVTVWCVLRQRDEVEAFRRGIPGELVRRNVTLAVLYVGLVAVITLILCVTMPSYPNFIDLLFQACSACGTVGLQIDEVARGLTDTGKLDLIAGMFIGRVGPLTLVFALASRVRRVEYSYPGEDVMIG